MNKKDNRIDAILASKLIEAFGGTFKIAKFFKISPEAVSQYKVNGMPFYRYQILKLLDHEKVKKIEKDE